MKTINLALILSLVILAGCDSAEEPAPTPVPQAPIEPIAKLPPPPPQYDFPIEENAMKSVQAIELLSAETTFALVVSNPSKIWELVQAEEPAPVDYTKAHAPELLDLHPSRLAAMGLDPERPVGIAISGEFKKPTESSTWAVFGTIKDDETFREAFGVGKRDKDGNYSPGENDRRLYYGLENGEVIIASRITALIKTGATLAQDQTFASMRDALDYGELATAYYKVKRGVALYGVGFDEVGFGVKVVGDSEIQAGTVRIKFAEIIAGADPMLAYLDRVIDADAERTANGRNLRRDLEELMTLPQKRRVAAAKEMMSSVPEVGSLDTTIDEFAVAGRAWGVSKEDVNRAYQEWFDLGLTQQEAERAEGLKRAIADVETMHDLDTAAQGKRLAEGGQDLAEGLNGGGMGGMGAIVGKMGGMLGGGGKGGKDGKKPSGPAGMLGGLGGMFGGGGGGKRDIIVTSSHAELGAMVRGHVRGLARCAAKAGEVEQFTLIANIDIAPKTGNVSLTRLRNAPSGTDACFKPLFKGKVKPPAPPPPPEDPNEPPPEPKPEKATVKVQFT